MNPDMEANIFYAGFIKLIDITSPLKLKPFIDWEPSENKASIFENEIQKPGF